MLATVISHDSIAPDLTLTEAIEMLKESFLEWAGRIGASVLANGAICGECQEGYSGGSDSIVSPITRARQSEQ